MGVQVYGLKSVIAWAENKKCPAWALFDGKRMMHKYEGDDESESIATLEEVLKMFQHTSIATYTIKFYEQPEDGTIRIKEKTECDGGSFNFKLCDNEELYQDARIKRYGASNETALEKRISALENNPAGNSQDDDEPQTIGEFLRRPDKVIEWANAIGEVMKLFRPQGLTPAPAYLGSVERITAPQRPAIVKDINEKPMPKEQQPANDYPHDAQMRLIVAINTLEANDPNILEHLEKLARLSADNKPLFDTLIKSLEAMK